MATINVTNATQLNAAIASAAGGDKIVLAAGNYGSVTILNRNYTSTVTIEAASPQQAHFDGLFIQGAKNLTFAGLDIGRTLGPTEPEYTQLSWIRDATNIRLTGLNFHGSIDNNPVNDGVGVVLTNVTGFNITDSKFSELYRGMAIQQSANVTVQGTEFKTIRSDGIVNAAVEGLYIENNKFSDFRPIIPDHSDFIQFWNTGQTRGSNNITIKNNVMLQPEFSGIEGTGTQGIFISDALEYGFNNILIQNNLIYSNGAYNGITVAGGTNVQIIDNTILSKSTDDKQFWVRLEDTSNVLLQGNISDNFVFKNVTKLYEGANTNLLITPGVRAQIPDLNGAHAVTDLLLSNVGYKLPSAIASAPVSAAAASSLGGLLSGTSGAAVTKVALTDDALSASGTLDFSNVKNAIVAVTAVDEAKPALPSYAAVFAPAEEDFASPHAHVVRVHHLEQFEHFLALP